MEKNIDKYNWKKQVFAVSIASLLVVSVFTFIIMDTQAENYPEAYISPAFQSVYPGETNVCVQVHINSDGIPVRTLAFKLTYPTSFTLISFTSYRLLGSSALEVGIPSTPGNVDIIHYGQTQPYGVTPVAINGNVATLCFIAPTTPDTYTLDLHEIYLLNESGDAIPGIIVTDGTITITDPPVIVYVDDDYTSSTPGWGYDHFDAVQDGIDAVADGGTVYVYDGTYYENVIVNKPIGLTGQDKNSTIIDGQKLGTTIKIEADNVSVDTLTIRNGMYHGLNIRNSSNNIINNCISHNNSIGIYFEKYDDGLTCGNKVSNCCVFNNSWMGIGIFNFSSNNTIQSSLINNNQVGIIVCCPGNNTIFNCTVTNNTNEGILIEGYNDLINKNNIIMNSTIANNPRGIRLEFSNDSTIANCSLLGNNEGIMLTMSNLTEIYSNLVHNGSAGIIINMSSSISLHDNIITNNSGWPGIAIGSRSELISIENNVISNNLQGIMITQSTTDILICKNSIESNGAFGLSFNQGSNGSVVYHNNFINNAMQAYDQFTNTWYSSVFHEGNYWSDFDESSEGAWDNNSDGIVDTPYVIPGGSNQDLYPLINLYDAVPPVTTKIIGSPKYGPNDEWVTSETPFNLTVIDDYSGVNRTLYRFWYTGVWSSWMNYGGNFTLTGEGLHYLEYYSIDNNNNFESIHNQTHYVDDTPPRTIRETGNPNYESGMYVKTTTPMWLNTTDKGTAPWIVGCNYTHYEIWWDSDNDGSADTMVESGNSTSNSTIVYFDEECVHELWWYSVDYLGNTEIMAIQMHYVDETPPVAIVDPVENPLKVPFKITVAATDFGCNEGCDVSSVDLWFRVSLDNVTWGDWTFYGTDYKAPWKWKFTAPPKGSAYYQFYALGTDNLGNMEVATFFDGEEAFVYVPFATFTRPVSQGWNLVTLPFSHNWTAETLGQNITGCSVISMFNSSTQTFVTHVVGVPHDDFFIMDGIGYFVYLDTGTYCGGMDSVLPPVNVSIYSDWNIVGWYHGYNTTAELLGQAINGTTVVIMFNSTSQTFLTHVVGTPHDNFTIERGMGLFIYATEASIWHGEG